MVVRSAGLRGGELRDRFGSSVLTPPHWTADDSQRPSSQIGHRILMSPHLRIPGPTTSWGLPLCFPRLVRVKKTERSSSSLASASQEHDWHGPSAFWKHTHRVFSLSILTRCITRFTKSSRKTSRSAYVHERAHGKERS